MIRLGETIAQWHKNNAQLLAINTARRARLAELIIRLAEKEGMTERETDEARRDALSAMVTSGQVLLSE